MASRKIRTALYILVMKVGKIFTENKSLDPGLYIVSYRLRLLMMMMMI